MKLTNPFLQRLAHHPIRYVLQNNMLLLPGVRRIQRARSTTGAMNDLELMVGWAKEIIEAARRGGTDIIGSELAEVGPGHSLGLALCLLLAGASHVAAIDVEAFADLTDTQTYQAVVDRFRRSGMMREEDADLARLFGRLDYSVVNRDGGWPLPDESRDVVYSYFSGEHLRFPEAVLRETHRVLRPNGLCLHVVDLRDHDPRAGNWLHFLYYEPWLWEAMHSRRGKWCNRLRAPDWRALFERYFELVSVEELRLEPFPKDFDRTKLATPFQKHDDQTLSISHLRVIARKPARTAGS